MQAARRARPRQPFIVREIPATMLRKNVELSKGARNLWTAMLSLADARTGELRHRDHWYDGRYIEREAEICDRLRKKYIRELQTAGLVKMERIRMLRVIHGRLREVLGPTHYTVFRSSTVTFGNRSGKSPTILSELHQVVGPAVVALREQGTGKAEKRKNHHPAPAKAKADDDSSFGLAERVTALQERASRILAKEGLDPDFVQLAFKRIDERSADAGAVPGSPDYYIRAFRTLLANARETAELTDELLRRRRLREKWKVGDPKVTPELEKDWRQHALVNRTFPQT
jgi:hypothetical protein